MRFLLDMPISMETTHFLRDLGYDAIHLREEGLQKLPDPEIVTKAIKEQRIVISMDLDFGKLLAQVRSSIPSVILFRLEGERPAIINSLLKQHLSRLKDDLKKGAVIVIEEKGIRIRHLPI